tara:strand:+ start:715 stop:1017 length:303 start_codon:yes stop_codon:yes gene_type:complete
LFFSLSVPRSAVIFGEEYEVGDKFAREDKAPTGEGVLLGRLPTGILVGDTVPDDGIDPVVGETDEEEEAEVDGDAYTALVDRGEEKVSCVVCEQGEDRRS